MKNKSAYIQGILDLVECLYYKYPKGTLFIGYANDILSAKFGVSIKFDEKTEKFTVVKVK